MMQEENNKEKVILVPCKTDKNGKISLETSLPTPYGYHHVVKQYPDGSIWLIMTISVEYSVEQAKELAKVLAGETPVEIDQDFYKNKYKLAR